MRRSILAALTAMAATLTICGSAGAQGVGVELYVGPPAGYYYGPPPYGAYGYEPDAYSYYAGNFSLSPSRRRPQPEQHRGLSPQA